MDKRLTKIETEIKKFVYQSEFDSEKNRIQNELFDFTREKLDNFEVKLVDHAKDLEKKKIYCEDLVKENQANTLWKISDCEGKPELRHILELLQKRVSEKYVTDTVSVLELKLNREIDSINKRDTEKQKKLFDDAISRTSALAKQNIEEFTSIRGNLGYLETTINKKANPEDIKTLTNTIKDVKYGYERECEITTQHIHKLEDKLAEFNRRFIVVESFTKNSKDKTTGDLDSKKSDAQNNEYNGGSSIKFKVLDDRVKNLAANFESIKLDVDKKAENSELVRIENTKVSKDELMSLLPSEESKDILKEEFKSEIAYFHRTIDELRREWDIKLVRLRKEMDLFPIKREINMRAKEQDVRYEIGRLEDKYGSYEQLINRVSIEFEGVKEFIKRITKNVKELQEVNQGVLLGKQNIN